MALAIRETYSWENLVSEICFEVSKLTGNVMAEKQRPMVESRMRRRCLELKLDTPPEYRKFWSSNRENENKFLIGLLTTHFTSFFREFSHFEWIAHELPLLVENAKKEGRHTIKIWSAASSKGQEVWSLCMWLHHHMPKIAPKMNWLVVGSDIDQASVKEGENGVYHSRELETAPRHLWQGLWLRGKDDIADWYKIKSDLKNHARFMTMNLLKPTMPTSEKFDIIMCRNVLIYFDRENQEVICNALLKHLTPQGALITGMSESLNGMGLAIKGVAPSIYRLLNSVTAPVPLEKSTALLLPYPLKVFCIDDSPTVLTILKKILRPPEFEIIGMASNGQEALDKLKTLKPDVITLDLHMPIMDGPTFLKMSGIAKGTPVVVVSSVGRDHTSSIAPLFELGVCDFVEKPTLTNMNAIGDELGQKLKMGWRTKKEKIKVKPTESIVFKQRPNARVIFNFSQNDLKNVLHVLGEQLWTNDEVIFYFNGVMTESSKTQIIAKTKATKKTTFLPLSDAPLSTSLPTLWLMFNGSNVLSLSSGKKPHDFVIVEENINVNLIREFADDISPYTSFSYLVDKLLGGK